MVTGWRSRRRPSWGATEPAGAAAAGAAAAGDIAGEGCGSASPPPPPPSVQPTAGTAVSGRAYPGGGLLEAVLPPDTIELVFSYLDTRTIMALTRVARAVARQARGQVGVCESN